MQKDFNAKKFQQLQHRNQAKPKQALAHVMNTYVISANERYHHRSSTFKQR